MTFSLSSSYTRLLGAAVPEARDSSTSDVFFAFASFVDRSNVSHVKNDQKSCAGLGRRDGDKAYHKVRHDRILRYALTQIDSRIREKSRQRYRTKNATHKQGSE